MLAKNAPEVKTPGLEACWQTRHQSGDTGLGLIYPCAFSG